MTQVVSSSAVKQQIAMTLLMAPSQSSHFLEKQGLGEEILRIRIFHVSDRALAAIIQIRERLLYIHIQVTRFKRQMRSKRHHMYQNSPKTNL
ncbi:hypothetical protein E2C01_057796 [Portunus trituberculatus]|uniref:Uncharacterized protein n=1 Tax=Portunus trituberculatus TaxID=210409 RepID=A0A5B7H4C6_PORTR|nr:hypothetical protein [Portunus trituberculatus]